MVDANFHGLIPIGSLGSECPYCGYPFKTRPKAKRTCGKCLKPVYVRERPFDMKKVLLREEDLGELAHQKSIFFGGVRSVEKEKEEFDRMGTVSVEARVRAGGMFPPLFEEHEYSALIIALLKRPSERFVKGDVLLHMETPTRRIKVTAPGEGVVSHFNTEPGRFVREDNQLFRILDQPRPKCRIKVSIVDGDHGERLIRIDYIAGIAMLAREWVSPYVLGVKGERGRKWCAERFGYVPETLEELAQMICDMPPIENLHLATEDERTKITRISFLNELKSGVDHLTGDNLIFLEELDQCELEHELNSIRLDVQSSDSHPQIPGWWSDRWDEYKNKHLLINSPLDMYLAALRNSCRNSDTMPGLSQTQAIAAIGMACSIGSLPTPNELHALLPSIWQGDPVVFNGHVEALYEKISGKIDTDWVEAAFGPLGELPKANMRTGLCWYSDNYWFEQERASIHYVANALNSERFKATLKDLFYMCSNEVREDLGLPRIGEGWVSEAALCQRVATLLPDVDVVHHGKPEWLGRQHLDIWIPQLKIAIEYQGIQHYEPVPIFGGEDSFADNQARDQIKKRLCEKNGVRLIEVRYDQEMSDDEILSMIKGGQ